MSTATSTLYSPPWWPSCPHIPPKITSKNYIPIHRLRSINNVQGLAISTPQIDQRRALGLGLGLGFYGKKFGLWVRAVNGEGLGERKNVGESLMDEEDKELQELRSNSTMPDRFRYLTKEAPDPPLRWPWFVALGFLIYAWRSVLWELSNWRKALFGLFHFIGYLYKFILAFIFHFLGDPITYTILCIETTLHAARSFCFSVITSAPILELTIITALASTVLAIGEAASPNSVNCQPYLLTTAGLIGYAAVRDIISEPVFWVMLAGLFCLGRLVKKRDYVTSALPVAAVLASVGEPWVRLLAIVLFTALAIQQHSKRPLEEKEVTGPTSLTRKVSFPLVAIAGVIGIRLAAKLIGIRPLT